MRRAAANSLLENLDRGLPPISGWQQLYTWLGRGTGWAYFNLETGNELVPHWFGDTEYRCQQMKTNGCFSGPFFDLDAFGNGNVRLESVDEMIGPAAEKYGETERRFAQFAENFIITRKPIFVA